MVAAIRAFDEEQGRGAPGAARPPRPAGEVLPAGANLPDAPVPPRRRDSSGILWTRSESSLGRVD
jgi:hypothetical protein